MTVFSKSYASREFVLYNDMVAMLTDDLDQVFDFASLVKALHEAPDLEIGEVCVAFLDDLTGNIRCSLAHYVTPDSEALIAAVQVVEEEIVAKSLRLDQKQDAPIFIKEFEVSAITKVTDKELIQKLQKMGLSTKEDKGVRVPTAVLIHPKLFQDFLSFRDYPIEPMVFLEKALDFFEKEEVTVSSNGRRKNSNSIHKSVMNILVFAVYAVLRSKNGLDFSIGLVKLEDPKVSDEQAESFLNSALLSCSRHDQAVSDEDNEIDDGERTSFLEVLQEANREETLDELTEEAGSKRSSFGSVSPSLMKREKRRKDQNEGGENLQASKMFLEATKALNTVSVNLQEVTASRALASDSSKGFFEKEVNIAIKAQFLMLQSPDGIQPATSIDPETDLFMRLQPNNQANTIQGFNRHIKVEVPMLTSIRSSIATNPGFNDRRNGISILAFSVEEQKGTSMSLNMYNMPDTIVANAFTQQELRDHLINPKQGKVDQSFHLEVIFKAFRFYLEKVAGPESFLTKSFIDFALKFQARIGTSIHFLVRDYGVHLLPSILKAIHGMIAPYATSCFEGSPRKSFLQFDDIIDRLEGGTFMNLYGFTPVADTEPKQDSQSRGKKKRNSKLSDENSQINKKVSSLPELKWDEWKKFANAKEIRRKKLTVPELRGKAMCLRLYYDGECSDQKCFTFRCHDCDLNATEKKLVTDFKNKASAQG